MATALDTYQQNGWCKFAADEQILEWTEHAQPAVKSAIKDTHNQHWFRYQNTWFVGVNALPNDSYGRVLGGPPLQGAAANFIQQKLGRDISKLDQAQISAMYPGYPKPSETEPTASFNYRVKRDAAHVDGLLRESNGTARYAQEFHEYILAISMTHNDSGSSPFVVWQGSHNLFNAEFSRFFDGYSTDQIAKMDLSECYKSIRKTVFNTCKRVELPLKYGECVVAHRMLLHGTAPWQEDINDNQPRILCFFRPITLTAKQWLSASDF